MVRGIQQSPAPVVSVTYVGKGFKKTNLVFTQSPMRTVGQDLQNG